MANQPLPDLEKTSFIFVGQVSKVEAPAEVHGQVTQSVTYIKTQVKMGLKTYIRDPMTVYHPVDKPGPGAPPTKPDLLKVGNVLVVGTVSADVVTYVQPASPDLLQAIHQVLEKFVEENPDAPQGTYPARECQCHFLLLRFHFD